MHLERILGLGSFSLIAVAVTVALSHVADVTWRRWGSAIEGWGDACWRGVLLVSHWFAKHTLLDLGSMLVGSRDRGLSRLLHSGLARRQVFSPARWPEREVYA